MPENLVSFIQVLRTHDLRVSPAETLDAMQVASAVGYADRELLRDGLGMTLAGAEDETATEMAAALGFTQPEPLLHQAANATDLALEGRSDGDVGAPRG